MDEYIKEARELLALSLDDRGACGTAEALREHGYKTEEEEAAINAVAALLRIIDGQEP